MIVLVFVRQALTEHVGREKFILERASIDELFIDVTDHCYDFEADAWSVSDVAESSSSCVSIWNQTKQETVICKGENGNLDEDDPETRALWRGCVVAKGMRKAVFDKLGFTLSAGISFNKLVAKLGASYGKPNGQAVIFPSLISHVSLAVDIALSVLDHQR